MSQGKKVIPTGRFSRFAKMSGLSTAVSSSYVMQRVKGIFQDEESRAKSRLKAHIKNAERMVDTMGHMKGAVMKVGQMLSLGDDAHVPKEFTDILTKLQAQAPTLPFEEVYDEIVKALGRQPDELFDFIDAEPLAAASLAQVHRARFKDGREVVLKVQYPGIADTVVSDLDNLKTMIRSSGMVGKHFNLDDGFQEVQEMLELELDYRLEAENLLFFKDALKDWDRIVIPKIYPEYCSDKLLVMEFIEGMSFDEWLETNPSQAMKNELGMRFVDVFFHCLFNLHRIHADPQLGNFRFREDGTIVMLDFGCVRTFDAPFVNGYQEAVSHAYHPLNRETFIQVLQKMDFLGDPPDAQVTEYLIRHANLMMEGFSQDHVSSFVSDDYPKRIRRLAMDPVVLRGIKFPRQIIYLNRVHIANYFLMRRLEVQGNFFKMLTAYATPHYLASHP